MKVTPDRIKARAEQLRTQGFKIRATAVRETLELNAGAKRETHQVEAPEPKQQETTEERPVVKAA